MKIKSLKLSVFFLLFSHSFSIQVAAANASHSDTSVDLLTSTAIHVNINSPNDGDGTSWESAFNNLQTALNSAKSGDQIWVAQGIYTPSQGYNVLTGSQAMGARTETFKIPSGVQVYGGFNGTETNLSQRNFKTNLTILSGDLDADNVYHVVFFFRAGTTDTQLDGFTISGGMANGISPNNTGGGIFNNGSGTNNTSNPTIRNCNLINNSAADGAAIYNNGSSSGNSSPVFVDCVFSSNVSTNRGGAVFNNGTSAGNSSPAFINCLFVSNKATTQGGAVYNIGISGNSSPSFTNVTFYNNSANTGRILYASGNGNTTMTNDILWDTTALPSLISLVSGATVSINYSDITEVWPGTGNLNADPLFTNESNLIGPDLIWGTNDDGLILQLDSPALTTGTSTGAPTTDIAGNPQTTPASMGCYTAITEIWPGTGNRNADPLFTNESNLIEPDLNWGTNDDDLSLQLGSPALITDISTGTPTTDIADNPQTTPASMEYYTASEVLLPPTNFQGKQQKNDFGLQYDLYNQLTWTPSSSSDIIGYFIYCDKEKIAQVDASTYTYKDYNRKKGASYIYAVTAFDSVGRESSPVTLGITILNKRI